MANPNRTNLEAAPLGALIVDEDGRFIAAKVSYGRDDPWYTDWEEWADAERLSLHQAGINWRLIVTPGLEA